MMASLLGAPDAVGLHHDRRHRVQPRVAPAHAQPRSPAEAPEVIAPVTMHFSFRLGAELMGIRLVEIDVGDGLPAADRGRRAGDHPAHGRAGRARLRAATSGTLDPIEAFADLAVRKGLPLHVDAAFGGFILPFMRDLGYAIPPFDFSLPGVTTMMTDGHKLGLLPISTGFFLSRDADLFETIPTERTLIHTTSSTKPGSRAASAWATMRHLGRAGYRASTAHVLALRDRIAAGVTAIPGMSLIAPPFISVIGFTSDTIDLHGRPRSDGRRGLGPGLRGDPGQPVHPLSIHPSRSMERAQTGSWRRSSGAASPARRRR